MFEYYVAFVMGYEEIPAGLVLQLPFRIESEEQVKELVEKLRVETLDDIVIPQNWILLREIK